MANTKNLHNLAKTWYSKKLDEIEIGETGIKLNIAQIEIDLNNDFAYFVLEDAKQKKQLLSELAKLAKENPKDPLINELLTEQYNYTALEHPDRLKITAKAFNLLISKAVGETDNHFKNAQELFTIPKKGTDIISRTKFDFTRQGVSIIDFSNAFLITKRLAQLSRMFHRLLNKEVNEKIENNIKPKNQSKLYHHPMISKPLEVLKKANLLNEPKCSIGVYNQDCMDFAINFKPVGILNLANRHSIGGGLLHCNAQEEQLFLNVSLLAELLDYAGREAAGFNDSLPVYSKRSFPREGVVSTDSTTYFRKNKADGQHDKLATPHAVHMVSAAGLKWRDLSAQDTPRQVITLEKTSKLPTIDDVIEQKLQSFVGYIVFDNTLYWVNTEFTNKKDRHEELTKKPEIIKQFNTLIKPTTTETRLSLKQLEQIRTEIIEKNKLTKKNRDDLGVYFESSGHVFTQQKAHDVYYKLITNIFYSFMAHHHYVSKQKMSENDKQKRLEQGYVVYEIINEQWQITYLDRERKPQSKKINTEEIIQLLEAQSTLSDITDPDQLARLESLAIESGAGPRTPNIVLGALGCGAFHCPPEEVARIFHHVIEDHHFDHVFKSINFTMYKDRGLLDRFNKALVSKELDVKKTRPDLWQKIVAPNLADAFITEPQQPDLLDVIANRMLIALKSETDIVQAPNINICNGGLEITLENENQAQLLYYALRAKQPTKEPRMLYDALQAIQPNKEPFNPGLKNQDGKFIITLSPFELNQFLDAFYYEHGLFSLAKTECTLISCNGDINCLKKSIDNHYKGKLVIYKYREENKEKFMVFPGNGSSIEITSNNGRIYAYLSQLVFPKTPISQEPTTITKQTTISLTNNLNNKLTEKSYKSFIQKKSQPLKINKNVNLNTSLRERISLEIEKQGTDFKPMEINITHTGIEFYFSKRQAAIDTMAALIAFTPEQRFLQKTDLQNNTHTGFMIPASKMHSFLQSFGFEAFDHEKLAHNLQVLHSKSTLNFIELLEYTLRDTYKQHPLIQLTPAGLALNFRDHDTVIKILLMLQKFGLDAELKKFPKGSHLPEEKIIKNTQKVYDWNNAQKESYSLTIPHEKIVPLITLLLNPQNPLESATKMYREEIKVQYHNDYIRLLTGEPDPANVKPLGAIKETQQAESSKQPEIKPEKQEIDTNSAPPIYYTAQINGFKVLAIKDPTHAHSGELVNTTGTGSDEYPVEITNPFTDKKEKLISSEHAFHALKTIELYQHFRKKIKNYLSKSYSKNENNFLSESAKNAFTSFFYNEIVSVISITPGDFLKKLNIFLESELPEALANSIAKELNNNKESLKLSFKETFKKEIESWKTDFFDNHWHKGLSRQCMKKALEEKANLNPKFKQKLIDLAKAGIMIVEYSRHDSTWATGADGSGKNLLGILLMELGNEFLKSDEIVIHNPEQAFKRLQQHNPKDLSHNNLDACVKRSQHSVSFTNPDFFFYSGWINHGAISQFCRNNFIQHNTKLAPINLDQVVTCFASASTHHEIDKSLYSLVFGAGQAEGASDLSKHGNAIAGFPTNFTAAENNNIEKKKAVVSRAINQLFDAKTKGYKFIIPIRDYGKKTDEGLFFPRALDIPGLENKELNLWGDIVKKPDPDLAELYLNTVEVLHCQDSKQMLAKLMSEENKNTYREILLGAINNYDKQKQDQKFDHTTFATKRRALLTCIDQHLPWSTTAKMSLFDTKSLNQIRQLRKNLQNANSMQQLSQFLSENQQGNEKNNTHDGVFAQTLKDCQAILNQTDSNLTNHSPAASEPNLFEQASSFLKKAFG